MESFNAVHDLMEAHNLKSDQFGSLNFEAFVEYNSSAGNASEVTAVRIIRNGY